jgi:hypothetical protein
MNASIQPTLISSLPVDNTMNNDRDTETTKKLFSKSKTVASEFKDILLLTVLAFILFNPWIDRFIERFIQNRYYLLGAKLGIFAIMSYIILNSQHIRN